MTRAYHVLHWCTHQAKSLSVYCLRFCIIACLRQELADTFDILLGQAKSLKRDFEEF